MTPGNPLEDLELLNNKDRDKNRNRDRDKEKRKEHEEGKTVLKKVEGGLTRTKEIEGKNCRRGGGGGGGEMLNDFILSLSYNFKWVGFPFKLLITLK